MKCDELKAYIAPTPDEKGLADYYLKSEADKVIAELKGSQRWRKCSEELPKDGQIVWAYSPNERRVLNLHYHKSDSSEGFVCFPFIDDFYHGITHWMPFEIPKIPEETNK